MPRISEGLKIDPFWTTTDGKTVRLYLGDVVDVLKKLPSQSVHMCVTSPPYWGLRDYGVGGQIGSEKTPDEFVARMVEVFREVRRVLRDDGTLWLNLGDTYCGGGGYSPDSPSNQNGGSKESRQGGDIGAKPPGPKFRGLRSGSLVGIPWRVALALQADGWILRQDIIWCLSGGTWVYARTQKGDMPITLKDLYRLKPETVQLWNGKQWTQLLGMSRSDRTGEEIQIELRSGERISCTPNHRFPISGGRLIEASEIRIGHVIETCILPPPEVPKCPEHVGLDAAWLAGLYIAEGCGISKDEKFALSGHVKETKRWERVKKIAEAYGGSATLTISGNNQSIRVYGKLICSVVRELVTGKTAHDKGFAPVVWRYGNRFIQEMLDGYLSGDGCDNGCRWRLGFTRNANLARDIRVACARLGYVLTLKPCWGTYNGTKRAGYRGEIRKTVSHHHNEKYRSEVVAIRRARSRQMFEVGVADAPHTFALSSGVLTHNSKPSPMPESVRNRCTKAHEYVFLFAKKQGYFYDFEAIKEKVGEPTRRNTEFRGESTPYKNNASYDNDIDITNYVPAGEDSYTGRNKRSVWTISSQGYPGAHFATFPPKLIEPMIKAGTSEKGCCIRCRAPWRRVVEEKQLKRNRPNDYVKRVPERPLGAKLSEATDDVAGSASARMGRGAGWREAEKQAAMNTCANSVAGVDTRTVGWEPTCGCGTETVIPCTVLDPFCGAATTQIVSLALGRRSVGIDLSEKYLLKNAIPRIEGKLMARPAFSHLVPREYEEIEIGRPAKIVEL